MLTASDILCIARAMAPFVAPWRSMPRCLETSMDGCFAAMRLPISRTLTRPILSSFRASFGGICEVYPQILTLDRREDCLSMMRRQIGETRLPHSWNRRGMEDSGCTVCCGTDLPLLIPSLGESIYSACGGFFADGLPVNEVNTLTLVELLRAWTAGGAYDLMREDELGTLEVGKLADICVLDRDVFDLDYRDARDLAVDMTMSDGQIVFDRNKEA